MGRATFEAVGRAHRGDEEGPPQEVIERMQSHQVDNTRIVYLYGEVSEHSIASVIAQLLHLANLNRKPIHLVVSSYGGSVDEMMSVYDIIKFLPCPVYTIALGKVMSSGVLLLAAGVKGKRMMGASARIMIHPISSGIFGNVFEIENQTQETRRLQTLMCDRLVRETKMSKKQVEESIMKPMLDYYLTPEQAIQYGIVDKIMGVT